MAPLPTRQGVLGIVRMMGVPRPVSSCKSSSFTPATTETSSVARNVGAMARNVARASAGLTHRNTASRPAATASALSAVVSAPPVSLANRSRVAAVRALPVTSPGAQRPAWIAPRAMAVAILPAPIKPSFIRGVGCAFPRPGGKRRFARRMPDGQLCGRFRALWLH